MDIALFMGKCTTLTVQKEITGLKLCGCGLGSGQPTVGRVAEILASAVPYLREAAWRHFSDKYPMLPLRL